MNETEDEVVERNRAAWNAGRYDQCRGGIQEHRVAIWAGRSLKQCPQGCGVQSGVTAADRLDRRA